MRCTQLVPVVLALFFLSSCDGDMLAGDNSKDTAAPLAFNIVEFKRQGGPKCPDGTTEIKPDEVLCATVKFTYPQMTSDAKPELADNLNTFIQQQLLDSTENDPATRGEVSLESFAADFIDEYKQDPATFTSWEIERNVTVVFSTNRLVTLLFEEFGFTGGAHPFSGRRYSVLDLETGKQQQLADLLKPGYEPVLNVQGEKAFRVSRELQDGSSLEDQGFTFENNVFVLNDNFGVDQDGLNFIFNSYEIAPYAMGGSEFTIPYEDIHSLIREDGLLGKIRE